MGNILVNIWIPVGDVRGGKMHSAPLLISICRSEMRCGKHPVGRSARGWVPSPAQSDLGWNSALWSKVDVVVNHSRWFRSETRINKTLFLCQQVTDKLVRSSKCRCSAEVSGEPRFRAEIFGTRVRVYFSLDVCFIFSLRRSRNEPCLEFWTKAFAKPDAIGLFELQIDLFLDFFSDRCPIHVDMWECWVGRGPNSSFEA